jgi:hypothetical protein
MSPNSGKRLSIVTLYGRLLPLVLRIRRSAASAMA